MTAAPIVPARTVVLRQRPAEQLEQVPSVYDGPPERRYLKHVERSGPLLGLRPPAPVARVLWWTVATVAVAVGLTVLRLLVSLW